MSELNGVLTLQKKKVKKEGIFGVLSKVRSQRNSNDLALVENTLKNVDFIKGIIKKLSPNLMRDLLSRLNYKVVEQGEYLFKKGEREDLFYIILSGRIGIEKLSRRDRGVNKVLGVGKSFGELSFALFSENRRYSAVALEESHLATLDKESFNQTIGTMKTEILQQAQALGLNSFFKTDWSKYDLMRIAVNFDKHEFKRDNVIFKEGEVAEDIYFLKEGEVECTMKLPEPERELHEVIQENYDPSSPGKIKKIHLSLWNDCTIFGHEEFFEREILRQKNPKETNHNNQPLKRLTTVTVNSNKAEIWVCNAQVFVDFIKEKDAKFEDMKNLMNLKMSRREDIFRKSNDLSHMRYGSVPQSKRASAKNLEESSPREEPEFVKFKGYELVNRTSLPLLEFEFDKQLSQPRLPSPKRIHSTSPDHDEGNPIGTSLNLSSVMQFNFIDVQKKMLNFKKTIKDGMKDPLIEKGRPRPLFTKADQLLSFHNLVRVLNPHKNEYTPTTGSTTHHNRTRHNSTFRSSLITRFTDKGSTTYIPPIHTKDRQSSFSEIEFNQTPSSKYFGIRGINTDKLNTTSEFDKDIMQTMAPELIPLKEIRNSSSGLELEEIAEDVKPEKPKGEKGYQSNFTLYCMNKTMRKRTIQNISPLQPREPMKKKLSPLASFISSRRNLDLGGDSRSKNTQTENKSSMLNLSMFIR